MDSSRAPKVSVAAERWVLALLLVLSGVAFWVPSFSRTAALVTVPLVLLVIFALGVGGLVRSTLGRVSISPQLSTLLVLVALGNASVLGLALLS